MDIALPMNPLRSYYVTKSKNPIVFFKHYPDKMNIGDHIVIFETGAKQGTKGIRGIGTVDKVIPVLDDRGRWPQPGCYPFVEHYLRYVKNDPKEADRIQKIKEDFRWKLSNFKLGYILDFVYCPDELEYINEHNEPMPIEFNFSKMSATKIKQIQNRNKQKDRARDLQIECDKWLEQLGFYDNCGSAFYQYGVSLKDVKMYNTLLDLSHYVDAKGFKIQHAPKSWRYVQEN